ncbi:ThiF family adenylyltransferase [Maridesulfovibrio hydrothermalis]|uniref:UBA/THIF-type NAD/FAD binding protein n=1 Tax=Maridesulfovibrio hydrothermalis AM13 = DSM 14728 TaxID=1121451 RepID=L0REU2_9BACT|nr:ThiF family adenylyltransferase [Maridesulfovibrio hydrothermalis]CCO25303.1 UBA/THIF-type NAD/FAD binding protein [Maridesulfovibrio hydrothermalis AM13 = DSM 14728]
MNLEKKIAHMLKGQLAEKVFTEAESVSIAPHEVLRSISRELGLDRSLVEKVAFKLGAVPERYVRNLTTFSVEEQEKLFSSKVAVIGLGGLGGHLLESLARAGVGSINACDGDSFEPSNMNRQLLATENSLSQKKSEAAFELVRRVNPAVFLDVRSEFLEEDQFDDFILGADVVADCLGGLTHRKQLKEAAARVGVPMVTASVAGWAGIVSTVLPGYSSPMDFFGDTEGLEELLGTPAPAISTAIGIQSAEILKILSGKGAGLAGKALMFDLSKLYFDIVSI